MQIEITFACRECGQDTTLRTDTSDYGVLSDNLTTVTLILAGSRRDLYCPHCGHISGQVGLGYRFLESHRPSHERLASGAPTDEQ